jgi:hypothetical protein
MSARTKVPIAAAVLAAGAAFAQHERPATDPQAQLLEQIAAMRTERGETTADLIGLLHVLGLVYQENGDHGPAIVALEEARHVTRVHRGLFSVDEALLLMQQIRSEEALGLHQLAWDHEQAMLAIARRHVDEPRVAAIYRDLADDRSEVLRKYRRGELPPEIYLGCYYAGRPAPDGSLVQLLPPSCRSGNRDDVIQNLREEILMRYADAIEVIVKNGGYASAELRDLEEQTVRIARVSNFTPQCQSGVLDELLALEVLGTCLEPVIALSGQGVGANVGGWVSLVRLIAYEMRSGAPASTRGSAIAALADWHLLSAPADRRHFESSTDTALEIYERAYRELQLDGDAREWTTEIFSPALPITLPTQQRNPFASAATAASPRHIDVTFDVTRYGRGERIEILATSVGATRAEERDLIRLIESASFRPRFVDGALADSAPVVVRYHLSP